MPGRNPGDGEVTDSIRHTVEERYPGGCWVWAMFPSLVGMTEIQTIPSG